jgi:hypothetical protein
MQKAPENLFSWSFFVAIIDGLMMTDSERSAEEVHVLDSQIIRINLLAIPASKYHENLKYLIEPVEKNEYNK